MIFFGWFLFHVGFSHDLFSPTMADAYVKAPDGRLLLTASSDQTACVWDAMSGHRLGQPMTHQGTVMAAEFSAELGMLAETAAARLSHHLAEVGLPTHVQDIAGFAQEGLPDADALLGLMAQDKKVKRGKLTFILLEAVGRAVIANDVEPSRVRGFLQQKLSR